MKRILGVAFLGLLLTALGGCGGCSNKPLNTGGSTFVNHIMTTWTREYREDTRKAVDYKAIGSGEGIRKMIDKTFDFGCTDAPMTDEELRKAGGIWGEVVHIPLILGAVVPAYNLTAIKKTLRFTGPVLADIYLGKITRWNDKLLRQLNPGVPLPDQPITVVHRKDGSGTTYIWADYLSKVSPQWKKKVGYATSVRWPCGVSALGNAGVTQRIKKTPGAIGYIELTYAIDNHVPFGLVRNKEGKFIKADVGSVNAAADAAAAAGNIPNDLRCTLTDQADALSYPISGMTYAIVYRQQPAAKAERIREFLIWVTHQGQQYAEDLQYARLPQSLIDHAEEKIDLIGPAK